MCSSVHQRESLAQQKRVDMLENTTGHGISTGNDVVTLDLSELVPEVGARSVPASGLAKIPPDTDVITVMRSDPLSAAQAGVKAVRVLSTALLVLVLVLYALAPTSPEASAGRRFGTSATRSC